jgi:hypothetical protein
MNRDVEKVIANCEQCLRNHVTIPMEHPAKVSQITSIFDRIGVDLTFGLTETREGSR